MPASPTLRAPSFRKSIVPLQPPPERRAVRSLLDANGLRRTIGRAQVLEALLDAARADETFTPVALHARMAGQGSAISLPTVYKVLAALQRVGLVEPVASGNFSISQKAV